MTRMHRRLALALAFSVVFHALPLASGSLFRPSAPAQRTALEVSLQVAASSAIARPPLSLPEPEASAPKRRPPAPPAPAPRPTTVLKVPAAPPRPWSEEIKRQLKELDKQGKFYPEEAIARGLEGEALVRLVLDEAGNAAATRIEESSGHRLLDEAALHAAKSLKSLPAAAPRETLIPVRFRLR